MREADQCRQFVAQVEPLTFSPNDSRAVERLDELLELLDGVEDPSPTFPAIFRFFERNQDADIGNPGPLVHFLEKFYPAYLDVLRESVSRAPVHHTVWMVNRILNAEATPEHTRASLLSLLRATRNNHELPEEIRDTAARYLARQAGG